MQAIGSDICKSQQLTIGEDLGNRSRRYCVLNAAGDITLERKLARRTAGNPSKGLLMEGTVPDSLGDSQDLRIGVPR